MLTIKIPGYEMYDEENDVIVSGKDQILQMEHSLISLSKWESKWQKPYLDDRKPHTIEEQLDYIRCMTITRNVDPVVYQTIPQSIFQEIYDYINSPMTATTVHERGNRPSREIITSELIYYWMIECGIPFECEKWHLARLLMLIRVCNAKNGGERKMSKKEVAKFYAEENARRCRAMKTKG